MLALVVVLLCCVALLAVLVAGLLRSHADILRALHDLGAGVGDPSEGPRTRRPVTSPVPLTMGPPTTIGPALAAERHSTEVHDVAGSTPAGDAVSVSLRQGRGLTLLAFLSSGCATCTGIWAALRDTAAAGLPPEVRVVAVTKGPHHEIAAEVASKAPPGVLVVMSSEAWTDYEVPASPFFALVDAGSGRRVGEGVAPSLDRVADLVRRAIVDAGGRADASPTSPHRSAAAHLDGPGREADNDRQLHEAGVHPGDASLYPRRLDDVFAGTASDPDRP